MIKSSYREYIKLGGTEKLDRFIGTGEEKVDWREICKLDFLEYHRLIGHYQKLFGASNILVLPFELLKQDSEAFKSKILSFCEITEDFKSTPQKALNKGKGASSLFLLRKLNRVLKPAYFGSKKPPLSWRVGQKLVAIFNKFLLIR